jgi:hypothetical protein
MAFMGKSWVTLAERMRYEWCVLRRALEEINSVAILCTSVFGGVVTCWLQYEEGLRPARDSVRIFGTAALGALAAKLLHFWFLALAAPAKMDAEANAKAKADLGQAEAKVRQLEASLAARTAPGPRRLAS